MNTKRTSSLDFPTWCKPCNDDDVNDTKDNNDNDDDDDDNRSILTELFSNKRRQQSEDTCCGRTAKRPRNTGYDPTTTTITRYPCKARNTPIDHDEETAYFEIPSNAEHGLLLRCSHPSCNVVRFRYCAHCHKPVAKRNFPKRHGHQHHNKNNNKNNNNNGCGTKASSFPPIVCNMDDLSTIEEASTLPLPDGDETLSTQGSVASTVTTASSKKEVQWLKMYHQTPDFDDPKAIARWMMELVQIASQPAKGRTA